jgi:hypothetical protein
MKRFIATIAVFGPALLIVALSGNGDKPKATASPAPIIDHSAELAAKDARIAELSEQLSAALETRAAQAVQPDAPAVEGPSAGVPTSTAAFVAYPRVPLARSQSCAGGFCQPAAAPKRYVQQSKSEQPQQYLFNGPIARRIQRRR